MKKLLIGILVLGSFLFAEQQLKIDVKEYDVKLSKDTKFLKVTNEEFVKIMSERIKKFGRVTSIEQVNPNQYLLNDNYHSLYYKNGNNIIAETIENLIVERGIDFNLLQKELTKRKDK